MILKNFLQIESVIWKNINKREDAIVAEIVNAWNSFGVIDLNDIIINGINYSLWVKFHQFKTHGKMININDIININNQLIGYKTEYGDIAIIVDYIIEDSLINRKISILQSKKEKRINQVEIDLHQLYLMHYWPNVTLSGQNFNFRNIKSDDFSFYHFILNQTNDSNWCSTICSAQFVSMNIGINYVQLINYLKEWLKRKNINSNTKPPSRTLKINLSPRSTPNNEWSLIPKPFRRKLKEIAYLFWGTSDQRVIELSKLRIPNILRIDFVAGRSKSDWIEKSIDL